MSEKLAESNHLKKIGPGCPSEHANQFDQLRSYLHRLEFQYSVIYVAMLCRELKYIDQLAQEGSMETLRHRVYRFLQKESFVQRRVIHVAQNTKFNNSLMNDFVDYVNEVIERLAIGPDNIVNIDETNFDFDMSGKVTLARQGSQTVNETLAGCSACVTALLGVTMSGIKLAPILIFKGKLNGQKNREFSQFEYPEG